MLSDHHHNRDYVAAVDDERRARANDLERLVRAAARGEEAAWSAIVRRFTRRLTGLVRAHRVPSQAVDDIVQTTFIRLYENLDSVREPRALAGWLDTTARRETLRSIQATLREHPLDVEMLENVGCRDAVDVGPGGPLGEELRFAIERLPDRQRSLLTLLSSPDEPSYEEISRRLDMPVGSIGPTRGRALERLRRDELLLMAAAEEAVCSSLPAARTG